MEQKKVNWNDDRLDHFAAQVDKRFDRLEGRIEAQSEHFDARFDSLQQAMIVTLASILTAFAALVAATIF
jgi:hypothetical protein